MEIFTWQEIISQLINAISGILVPVMATYAVLYAKQGLAYLKLAIAEKNPDMLATLEYVAREAVKFAEQIGVGDMADRKMDEAIKYAQREMNLAGFPNVDVQLIADKLEAALYDEINKHKQLPPLA